MERVQEDKFARREAEMQAVGINTLAELREAGIRGIPFRMAELDVKAARWFGGPETPEAFRNRIINSADAATTRDVRAELEAAARKMSDAADKQLQAATAQQAGVTRSRTAALRAEASQHSSAVE